MNFENIIIAVISCAGVIVAASLTYLNGRQLRAREELAALRNEVKQLTEKKRALWLYLKTVINSHYKQGQAPPAPPAQIAEMFKLGGK